MPISPIQLTDGCATAMGDGHYALQQRDEYGKVQTVVIHIDDLQKLPAAPSA